MSWSKRQFINQAFEEIGLASYVFDIQPEQMQSAVNKLDSMMATWNGMGVRIAYPLISDPSTSDVDALTDVPDIANEAIYLNLAIRLGPMYGKNINPATIFAAKKAFDVLLIRASFPSQMRMNVLPAGAGYKSRRRVFIETPHDELAAGTDSPLILE